MKKALILLLLISQTAFSQHSSKMIVAVDVAQKVLTVQQDLTFFNQTNDTLSEIVLNDWMNGFTSKNTPLAARFSDEFERGFHLAKEKERGRTTNIGILDETRSQLTWTRNEKTPDVIEIQLKQKLLPNQKITLHLSYIVKIPSDRFTKHGYGENIIFLVKK